MEVHFDQQALLKEFMMLQQEINLTGMGLSSVQDIVRPTSGVFPTAYGDFYDFPTLGIQIQIIDSKFMNIGISDGAAFQTLDTNSSEFDDFVTLLTYINNKGK